MVSIGRIMPFAKTLIGKSRPLRSIEKPVSIFSTPKVPVTNPLMQYKYTSTPINEALSYGIKTDEIRNQISAIERFLNTQSTKADMEVFRGEGNLGIFKSVKLDNGKNLGEVLEEFTAKIEANETNSKNIKNFIDNYLLAKNVTQERFFSTAIIQEGAELYAKKVLWHIKVPKGSKGSMIESYNVERESEAEMLMQRASSLLIKDAKYDKIKNRWELWAELKQ